MMNDNKVNTLVSSLVQEVSASTLDKFKAYLNEKVELDSEMLEYFDQFKAGLKTTVGAKGKGKGASKGTGEEKKKRALSPYNIYIKNKMLELKQAGHTGNLMKLAVEAYNKDKANGTLNA